MTDTSPGATILVTGYPDLFETPPPTDPNDEAIAEINAVAYTAAPQSALQRR